MSSTSLVRPGLTTPFSKQLAQIRVRLRKKVSVLSANDVRRARIPYYEAIASELYEEGNTNAAFLVLSLIKYEDQHVWPTSDLSVECRRLCYSSKLLDYFRTALASIERRREREQYEQEVLELLAVARKFASDPEKHWMAHQFFLITLERNSDCRPAACRLRTEAMVRYYYGRFLMVQRKEIEAMKQLQLADAAVSKAIFEGYPVGVSLDESGESLDVAINCLLFRVNHNAAEDCKESPMWMRGQYIRDAHQAALKTQKATIMSESYIDYGHFLSTEGHYPEALTLYKNAARQAELDGSRPDLLCKARIAQASTYHRLREGTKCKAMFQLVDRMTSRDELSLCRASYLHVAATIELEEGGSSCEPQSAERLMAKLRQAGNIYQHFQKPDKMIAVRCLEGLVRADAQFAAYVNLIPAAVSTSDAALYRMIDWLEEARVPQRHEWAPDE
ncbi:uncharacterized protein LOC131215032 [Anopheles bellator]|uniref:uncharacterized protein LOC131215032 n=1 Tax=Anopheles bellator TaxID=139047 RepID=UPI0026471C53|nr:uncharacterized protein LOC131215032 [Anopheles bellator]